MIAPFGNEMNAIRTGDLISAPRDRAAARDHAGRGIADDVGAELLGRDLGVEPLVAGEEEDVKAGLAVEVVGTRAAIHRVVARARRDGVGSRIAVEDVVAAIGDDRLQKRS